MGKKKVVTCPVCGGSGKVYPLGVGFLAQTCPKCHGTGNIEVWEE